MINVNGEPLQWFPDMTVRDAIRKKNYVFPLLVVRIDGRLVSREAYDSARIPAGARVDIIHLISGG